MLSFYSLYIRLLSIESSTVTRTVGMYFVLSYAVQVLHCSGFTMECRVEMSPRMHMWKPRLLCCGQYAAVVTIAPVA